MQEKEKGGFSFINEKIKEKPLNKKYLIKICKIFLANLSESCYHSKGSNAGMSELADEADSKSVGGNIVRVQVPLPAVSKFFPTMNIIEKSQVLSHL